MMCRRAARSVACSPPHPPPHPLHLHLPLDLVRFCLAVPQGLVTPDQGVLMVEPRHLDQLLHPMFENEKGYQRSVITKGLAASPGAAVGRLVFSAEEAEDWKARGEAVILCRQETSPEDVGGMHAAEGILTSRGGMTSHAAVVARGWGKPCVCGCETLLVDAKTKALTCPVRVLGV